MKLAKQWVPNPPNSEEVIIEHFHNKLGVWIEAEPERLKKFTELLGQENGEDGSGLSAAELITAELKNDFPQLSLNEFLFSTNFNPPIVDEVRPDDMNAPLSHYFIRTSLKSFLNGNKLFGKFSDVPIIDALKRGVRVVELDLLPHGRDGICVATSKFWPGEVLTLQRCLISIKEHAFTDRLKYPVIITFKDNLTPDLQSRAIQMINDTFVNMVYHHDPKTSEELPSPADSENNKELPSPTDLENKIIITRRSPKKLLYANNTTVDVMDVKLPLQLIKNYQRLVAFHAVELEGMLQKALTKNAMKIHRQKSYEEGVIRFTQDKFLRTRLKNKSMQKHKPQRGWMYGVQLIALGEQEYNRAFWLMQGMFRANGGCGYVKKPDFLLDENSTGVSYPMKNPIAKTTLKVKIYMGVGCAPNLFVMIGIAGAPLDELLTETRVENNRWEEKEFTFALTYPELALLSIEVYDNNIPWVHEFAGQTCLPVSELREGIRAVPLYNQKGEKCSSTMLLMRFKY